MARSKPYEEALYLRLQDPAEATEYLTAALEDEDPGVFLLALRHVTEAHGGIAATAEGAKLSRETLYRTLSPKGNPTIKSLTAVLHTLGMRLAVEPEDGHRAHAAG